MNQSFKDELTQLINKYGFDAKANTPDYLLAEYVVDVLSAHIAMTRTRDEWKERKQAPETPHIPDEIDKIADAISKALNGNCTVEIIGMKPMQSEVKPKRKRKRNKSKYNG